MDEQRDSEVFTTILISYGPDTHASLALGSRGLGTTDDTLPGTLLLGKRHERAVRGLVPLKSLAPQAAPIDAKRTRGSTVPIACEPRSLERVVEPRASARRMLYRASRTATAARAHVIVAAREIPTALTLRAVI